MKILEHPNDVMFYQIPKFLVEQEREPVRLRSTFCIAAENGLLDLIF